MQPRVPFLFIANQPCLDFINTDLVMNGQPTDLLSSFQDLVAWLVQAGLLTEKDAERIEGGGSRDEMETLKQAKTFRRTMRDMAERLAARKPVPQAALDLINQLLRHRLGYAQVIRRTRMFERKSRPGSNTPTRCWGCWPRPRAISCRVTFPWSSNAKTRLACCFSTIRPRITRATGAA